MKIVQIIVGLNVGGAELMLKRLVESHRESPRYRHVVVSLTGLGVVGPQLQAAGVEVLALEMRHLFDAPRVIWRLVRLIRRTRPDVVQTWMYHSDLLGGIAARIAGMRRVIWGIRTTHVAAGNTSSTGAVMRLCARLSHWVPATIVCAAEAARAAHVSAGYDAAKMVVVPNGFERRDPASAMPAAGGVREQHGIAADAPVIGTVGRFNHAKDHANFVRAAGVAAARHARLRILMVGRDLDAGNAELASWIAATGHADRFVLLGERSDVSACLAAMNVFCLSSRSEGFPNVLGEAMSMGVACVTTDVGDAKLLIGQAGVVVPKEDAQRLSEGMERLLELTPEARSRLGAAARARICEEFSMARTLERFEAIYEQLAGEGCH